METNQERKVDRLYVGWTDKQKEREREEPTARAHTSDTTKAPLGRGSKEEGKKRKRRKEKEKKKKKKKHGFLPYLHARQENAGRAVAGPRLFLSSMWRRWVVGAPFSTSLRYPLVSRLQTNRTVVYTCVDIRSSSSSSSRPSVRPIL